MVEESVDHRNVDFADGEIRFYRAVGDRLLVSVRKWNWQRVTIRFEDVIRVLATCASDIHEFCELDEPTPFLQEALNDAYEVIPEPTPYRHFRFVGINGAPALDVVAARVTVTRTIETS